MSLLTVLAALVTTGPHPSPCSLSIGRPKISEQHKQASSHFTASSSSLTSCMHTCMHTHAHISLSRLFHSLHTCMHTHALAGTAASLGSPLFHRSPSVFPPLQEASSRLSALRMQPPISDNFPFLAEHIHGVRPILRSYLARAEQYHDDGDHAELRTTTTTASSRMPTPPTPSHRWPRRAVP